MPGVLARPTSPRIRQLLIAPGEGISDQDEFENRLYLIRRVAEIEFDGEVTFPSFSSRTLVYKGLLTAPQLARFYPDLRDPELVSVFAIVHSRFSTNTAPSWELAQPLQMIAHNGEINTVLGNINWMRARESALEWDELGDDLERCLPLINHGASDSAAFDRALELLFKADRSLPHALMMMIPMAYENRQLPDELRDFYAFHSLLLEPWDGPASIVFSDGRLLGATLDRNGLRPSRWSVTDDGWVALSSEAGTFSAEPENVVRRGRLQAGHLFIVDLEEGRIYDDREAEMEVARQAPYGDWFRDGIVSSRRPARARDALARGEVADRAAARLRLLAGGPAGAARADRPRRQGADRLDGQRRRPRGPLRQGALALLLLQAALRPGDEPGDRLGPRAHRDEPDHRRSARRATCSTRTPTTPSR